MAGNILFVRTLTSILVIYGAKTRFKRGIRTSIMMCLLISQPAGGLPWIVVGLPLGARFLWISMPHRKYDFFDRSDGS